MATGNFTTSERTLSLFLSPFEFFLLCCLVVNFHFVKDNQRGKVKRVEKRFMVNSSSRRFLLGKSLFRWLLFILFEMNETVSRAAIIKRWPFVTENFIKFNPFQKNLCVVFKSSSVVYRSFSPSIGLPRNSRATKKSPRRSREQADRTDHDKGKFPLFILCYLRKITPINGPLGALCNQLEIPFVRMRWIWVCLREFVGLRDVLSTTANIGNNFRITDNCTSVVYFLIHRDPNLITGLKKVFSCLAECALPDSPFFKSSHSVPAYGTC